MGGFDEAGGTDDNEVAGAVGDVAGLGGMVLGLREGGAVGGGSAPAHAPVFAEEVHVADDDEHFPGLGVAVGGTAGVDTAGPVKFRAGGEGIAVGGDEEFGVVGGDEAVCAEGDGGDATRARGEFGPALPVACGDDASFGGPADRDEFTGPIGDVEEDVVIVCRGIAPALIIFPNHAIAGSDAPSAVADGDEERIGEGARGEEEAEDDESHEMKDEVGMSAGQIFAVEVWNHEGRKGREGFCRALLFPRAIGSVQIGIFHRLVSARKWVVKYAFAFLPAIFVLAASAGDALIPGGHIELQGDHAVLVAGSLSADGRYAAGWTVHPKKGQAPVKWGDFDKEDNSFREDYVWNDGYAVTNVIVDLTRRAIAATLPFHDPYFGGKNHGGLQVVFGPERDGHRFAIALSDGKWSPYDAVLVDLAAEGATSTDILKILDAGVDKYIASQSNPKKRLSPEDYATDYRLSELPNLGLLTGFSDAETVRIPFNSEVPKSMEARAFEGTVLLRLSRGKGKPQAEAGEVREYKGKPESTQDEPHVAAADRELNAVYAAARNALTAAGKAKLLEEQRAWIEDREAQVAARRVLVLEEGGASNPRFATDELLLKLTRERTEKLRAQ